MSLQVLVVDDHPETVRAVKVYLEQAGYSVHTAYNGRDALSLARQLRPSVVVLDWMLPDYDGLTILRYLRTDPHLADTAVIMLTARVDDEDRITGLEQGADDYIIKPYNPPEVVARVRAVLRRVGGVERPAEPPEEQCYSGLCINLTRRSVTLLGAPLELTRIEFELLYILIDHPGRVFTRMELIERALHYQYEGMERTLDTHIKNLRKKLGDDPREPTYIHTVYGIGYRLGG
jgi:two-component system alkaline phosphatase synthesis response regulator PhoP